MPAAKASLTAAMAASTCADIHFPLSRLVPSQCIYSFLSVDWSPLKFIGGPAQWAAARHAARMTAAPQGAS
eukprot:948709-Prorocentrum_minimum.AAC.1